ncbi:MAG: iron-sulfur cluster assembly accessory protein [Gammaproteobacteria bacterium]|nr:MAG: iron-sulfur cluster assembly accessory protein [Gammaproteobacteria bacterium]
MTVEFFKPDAGLTLTLTEAAANFFRKKIAGQSAAAIRLSVKKSGCTGYAYVIDAVNEGQTGDSEMVLQGITLYVSEQAGEMINGSEIDLVKQGLNRNIVFNNPNVTNSCGCGSSFSVD